MFKTKFLVLFCVLLPFTRARADDNAAKTISGPGTAIYIAAGTLAALIEHGDDRTQHTLRTADSLLVSTLITEGVKRIVHEKRPDDKQARNSFPSGHATAAFAVATMESHYHPDQQWLWYGGAALIAASRVKLHRHYWHDVVAGAAVGSLTAHWELKSSHGLLLFPFIHSRDENQGSGAGIGLSRTF